MLYIGFPILSLIYIIILLIVYYSKERINLFENKVVSTLMIINAIGLILELLCYVVLVFAKIQDTQLGTIILKTYIFYMYIFDWVLTGYICMLTNKKYDTENYNKKEYFKKSLIIFSPVIIIGYFVTFFTKLEYYNISPRYYTYGLSTDFLVYFTSILAPFWIYRCIRIKRQKKSREYREYNKRICTILLGIILVGMAGALTQLVDRSILILTSAHTIMLVLMYFTIENPDMKMVEELSKNRKLTEQTFEEKSNFLFKVSQDLKKPLTDIERISNNIIENPKEDIKEQIKTINNTSKQLYTYVNSALDISNMDIKNLKIISNVYNTNNLFEEIKLRIQTQLENQNKKLEFRYNIPKTIPKYLNGDNTKLKQVILSIIFDSLKHTNSGFIELNVDAIVKYGICRMIIEISDSGTGMELDKINNILGNIGNLTPEELEKIDKLNISLPLAHKIIKSINGNLIIKSEVNKGTSFIIIIDQKIKEQEKNIELDKYSKKLTSNSDLMLISTDKKIKDEIINKLENKEITITNSLYGKDCINRIKDGEKYKLIIIDENLKEESALDILKELRQNDIKIPTIIMIEKRNEFLKEHYLEDGFTNIIIKEKIDNEVNIINKYL